jgi:UDPglucose 6-dehydrogenase
MGNKVYCVDIDEDKIENLKKGIIPIYEPHLATMVIDNQAKNNLFFTTDLKEALDNSNIIFIFSILLSVPRRLKFNRSINIY